jgi:hypothetical protein
MSRNNAWSDVLRHLNIGDVARLRATSRSMRNLGATRLVGPVQPLPRVRPPDPALVDAYGRALTFLKRIVIEVVERYDHVQFNGHRTKKYREIKKMVDMVAERMNISRDEYQITYTNDLFDDNASLSEVSNSNDAWGSIIWKGTPSVQVVVRCIDGATFHLNLSLQRDVVAVPEVKLYVDHGEATAYILGTPWDGTPFTDISDTDFLPGLLYIYIPPERSGNNWTATRIEGLVLPAVVLAALRRRPDPYVVIVLADNHWVPTTIRQAIDNLLRRHGFRT